MLTGVAVALLDFLPLVLGLGLLAMVVILWVVAGRKFLSLLRSAAARDNVFKGRVRKRPLMTSEQFRLYRLLRELLVTKDIMVHTSMDALMLSEGSSFRKRESIRGRYIQKRVDFLIVEPRTGEIDVIVELDDRTHHAQRDRVRDQVTEAAGYRTLRIRQPIPDRSALKVMVDEAIGAPAFRHSARTLQMTSAH